MTKQQLIDELNRLSLTTDAIHRPRSVAELVERYERERGR